MLEELRGWDEQALTEDAELTIQVYNAGYRIQFVPLCTSRQQQLEMLRAWFRQRSRRVPGSSYLFQKYAGGLLGRRPCRITVPGPYSLVWVFAYATFVLQLVIALSCEPGEDSLPNILLTFHVVKTERFEVT